MDFCSAMLVLYTSLSFCSSVQTLLDQGFGEHVLMEMQCSPLLLLLMLLLLEPHIGSASPSSPEVIVHQRLKLVF